MAIKFEKTQVKGGFPVFWRGEREVLPGDFAVKARYSKRERLSNSISRTWSAPSANRHES